MRYLLLFALLSFWVLMQSCGDARAIRKYEYPVTKNELEKAVWKVLRSNANIIIDTSEIQVRIRNKPNDPKDTSTKLVNISELPAEDSAYYASGYDGAISIIIGTTETPLYYTFRFLGGEAEWKISKTSALLLQHINNGKGLSVHQGQNENGEFDTEQTKQWASLFENEVVDKVDAELKLKHTED